MSDNDNQNASQSQATAVISEKVSQNVSQVQAKPDMSKNDNQNASQGQAGYNFDRKDWVETGAGFRYKYNRNERWTSSLLTLYLMTCMIFVFWFIGDIWSSSFHSIKLILWNTTLNSSQKGLLRLVLYGLAGGWLGGCISAMRSLQTHYASPIENVGDVEKQEKTRFHINWCARWFLGPWIAAGLAFVVIALVRAGILVFVSSASSFETITASENFASFGLGALVGLGAKDVVEKLIQFLKEKLQVEEPEKKDLKITNKSDAKEVEYGGKVIEFDVTPKIPVNWAIDPSDAGTIINGLFRSADQAPNDQLENRHVVVTASSKKDADRSVSTSIALRKPS